jgi:hypothetical protein
MIANFCMKRMQFSENMDSEAMSLRSLHNGTGSRYSRLEAVSPSVNVHDSPQAVCKEPVSATTLDACIQQPLLS